MYKPLVPCPGCRRHVLASESACPFCASALPADLASRAVPGATERLGRAAAFVFASTVALGACGDKVTGGGAGGGGGSGGAAATSGTNAATGTSTATTTATGTPGTGGSTSTGTVSDGGGAVALYGAPDPGLDGGLVDDGGGAVAEYGAPFPDDDGGVGTKSGAPPGG